MDWLAALADTAAPAVLVTVAEADGSTPRDPGAKMVVFADHVVDTIGGGNLELKAIERARAMLADANLPGVCAQRYPLGPALGQCCGGVATLVLERIDAARPAWLAELRSALARGESRTLVTPIRGTVPARLVAAGGSVPRFEAFDSGDARLHDPIAPANFPVYVFGAGHVGHAVVAILARLDGPVVWIDDREAELAHLPAARVRKVWTPMPALEVDSAPVRAFPQECQGVLDGAREVEFGRLELQPPRLDLREVEDIVDERQQVPT